jgi:acetolactate synthase I/II/III large subunit
MVTKVKLAEYVMDFLAQRGVSHVFAVSGGASLHLIHAAGDHPTLQFITPHHEQAAAMAADGYARATGDIGVAVATSGPGATNLITGICCSFYDSVPVLCLTGQVSTFRMVGDTGVRQIGFQETPIVELCKPITKYAVQLTDPNMIRYELEKAIYYAMHGRRGPVLVDIPDDFQRAMIEVENLPAFEPPADAKPAASDADIAALKQLIAQAERPVCVLGWGVHLSGAQAQTLRLLEALNIPVVLTWGAADVLPASHPLYVGTFGTHGVRHANFTVQNADLVLSLGARLDTKATGTPINGFARGAKKVMVDIDAAELNKFPAFGLTLDLLIQSDVADFVTRMEREEPAKLRKTYAAWFARIAQWKQQFAQFDAPQLGEAINPYAFFDALSAQLPDNAQIFIDTGCAIAWSMQRLKLKPGQRVYHDFNNTAMGWALPAAIGAYFANPDLPLVLVVGDGSFMMTLYELASIKHHRIPVRLFLLNNGGYSMIQQTQDQWLGSRYYASSHEGGLSFPDYAPLAQAFNMAYGEVSTQADCDDAIRSAMEANQSYFCNVKVPSNARVIPQVKFGRPNEDMEPLLPRPDFEEAMIVEPLAASRS